MNLVSMGIYIIVGYAVVLVVYSVLTYIQYSVRYYKAKRVCRSITASLLNSARFMCAKRKKQQAEELQEGIGNDSFTGI